MEMIEERKTEEWHPTEADVLAAIKQRGWPTFDDIRFDHINDGEERAILETAVSKMKSFVSEVEEGKSVAMIMLANAIDGDMDRTGYGCGKTKLAAIGFYANCYYHYSKEIIDSLQVHPVGSFYSARKIMALFDAPDFDERATFRIWRKILVIDDLGREGSLKWEKRDPEIQLQEKRDRYYSIINYCYNTGISLIITSNLTSREMATFLGGASWSRLLQMAPERYRVNMTGIRDMRPLLADDGNGWF